MLDSEECRFLNEECSEKMYMYEIIEPLIRIKYCQCCLIGKLVKELKLLRVTGSQ